MSIHPDCQNIKKWKGCSFGNLFYLFDVRGPIKLDMGGAPKGVGGYLPHPHFLQRDGSAPLYLPRGINLEGIDRE